MNTILRTPSYESSLSQAERLELCAGRFSPAVLGADESAVTTLSRPLYPISAGHAARVRLNDARLALHAPSAQRAEIEEEEETTEDEDLYAFAVAKRSDSMREASFRLPSQRGICAAFDDYRSMGGNAEW